ncbi:FlgD immunoglobulin-like domain containing protein [Streptomyces sp. NPDC053431]|uniref:FlgD immunoglobulin-like domain containing protein n=1 Tax=Streptomyces sp. NPDC053431 TaxID=3365703 RepID=UPI0037D560C3
MNLHARGSLAVVTAFGVTTGLCAALTAPAVAAGATTTVAAATDEVVVPDPGRYKPREETLLQAGATGYLHRQEGTTGLLWTDLATGTTTPQPTAAQYGHSGLYIDRSSSPATVVDIGAGTRNPFAVPAGQAFFGAFNADTLVTRTDQDGSTVALALVRTTDGAPVEVPVTGLPQGMGTASLVKQDAQGAIIRFSAGPGRFLLDYKSAALTRLPAAFEQATTLRLGADHVLAWSTGRGTLSTVPRSDPSAEPVTTAVQSPVDSAGVMEFAVVGSRAVFVRPAPSYDYRRELAQKLQSVPLGGGPVSDVLPAATTNLLPLPDGGVLAVAGSGASDWAVRRVTLGGDGAPPFTTVQTVPQVPATYSGVTLGGGRLSYLADSAVSAPKLFDVDVSATGTPTATAPRMRYGIFYSQPKGLRSLGDGDSAYETSRWIEAPADDHSRSVQLPASSTVVDASGPYVLAKNGDTTYVADLDVHNINDPSVPLTLTRQAAAVWATKVWKPAPTKGMVDAYDLKEKRTYGPLNIGSGCVPSELQAVGRWLYWACAAEAKAGVYDQQLKRSVPVTPGESLLGDGFVVRHDPAAHKLLLTDLSTGQTTDYADVPAWTGDQRGARWTVDKFGANVAYVDARHDIHVRRVPVAAQPFTLLDTYSSRISGGTSELRWRMSRTVGPWKLEIRNAAGRTVRTYQGATGSGAGVSVDWDSRDDLGRGIEDGTYAYVLTAQPGDGVGAALRLTGTVDAFDVGLTTLPGTYRPLTPARIMNTLGGVGVPQAKVGAGKTVSLEVAGAGGVPATGVTAVVLNVTATGPTAASYVSVYPSGTRQTAASNLNFKAGQTVANLVTVPVVDGKVNFFNKYGAVDLLADIAGYYTEGTSGAKYQPVTPHRILNTIGGVGAPKAKVGPKGTVELTIDEPGVSAVAMNVTATNPTATSYVSVYPYGTPRPPVSNLNFTAGRSVPNLVIVPVKDGKVTLYNHAGTVDLLADVTGYFKDGTGSVFTGMQPRRIMNTIAGDGVPQGKVGAGKTVDLYVGAEYSAVVLNVTATNPTATGYVSVYPYGTPRPAVSNLNFTAGQSVPNLVIVPVKDGRITFFNHSGSVDLLADIAGYYTD